MIFDDFRIAFQDMSDSTRRFSVNLDAGKKTLEIRQIGQPEWAAFRKDLLWNATLTFERLDPTHLAIGGALDGHLVHAKMHRVEEPRFYLTNRGFHWINEYPDVH